MLVPDSRPGIWIGLTAAVILIGVTLLAAWAREISRAIRTRASNDRAEKTPKRTSGLIEDRLKRRPATKGEELEVVRGSGNVFRDVGTRTGGGFLFQRGHVIRAGGWRGDGNPRGRGSSFASRRLRADSDFNVLYNARYLTATPPSCNVGVGTLSDGVDR